MRERAGGERAVQACLTLNEAPRDIVVLKVEPGAVGTGGRKGEEGSHAKEKRSKISGQMKSIRKACVET